ncbi:DNA polymerase iota [Cordyceps fumosorosea ARSEF 2679]|uniref:DNA polymerase iota n=1 Tax=Cordyceps fumosorosea (strain ARSEF 2679) TaxID=1081104 RepID=A0A168CBP8_CORFA|nr:DNA polymerase iota [Cordyceps fumosorosea ARSEF 2679]OAA71195.1 DNA polymerase iota [Cordyceps fumosorosea ARSEF 2679]
METPAKRPPKRREDRIILQFDYDCFYAQVFENKHPHLKGKPLGVRQKNILATCNYHARAKGVKKLMLVTEARRVCPALVLVDGEDLSPFRDVSKTLYRFLRSHSWSGKVERLGFDEVFMDVTDVVDYNLSCLARGSLARSFFQLSRSDPEAGFACDLGAVAGPVLGGGGQQRCVDPEDVSMVRLALGSHLAMHLRGRIEREFGYTSTCGVATNKLLSKLCGGKNKPRNQTTLLARTDDDVLAFMDGHLLRDVPGVGFKTAHLIETAVTGVDKDDAADSHTFRSTVTVGEARLHPAVSPAALEKLLAGPGAERGVGARIWALLHGVDATEVKAGTDVPSQLSIEDTYRGLETVARITEELFKLSCSLVRRMRVDLTTTSGGSRGAQRWLARPRTLRLSIRSWPGRAQEGGGRGGGGGFPSRVSRSAAVPRFLLDLDADVEAVAERLVAEALLPLLRRLGEAEAGGGSLWNLQLINVCVANMAAGAEGEDGEGGGGRYGAGRDIADMWKRQDEVLRPWKVVEDEEEGDEEGQMGRKRGREVEEDQVDVFDDGLDVDGSWRGVMGDECRICGLAIPAFAATAHLRYHEMHK